MNQTTYMDAGLVESRAQFIVKTYLHLFAAIVGFVAIEYYLFSSGLAATIAQALVGVNWLFVLGAFMLVAWLASRAAHQSLSKGVQYLALASFVAAEAIIFVPMLYFAESAAPGVIQSAGLMTLAAFASLTFVAFFTRKNFSFLRPFLIWGGLLAIGLIVVSALVGGFNLGYWFAAAMVLYAGGAILYDTSNIIHEFQPGQHISAALQLFASVALMFWYILQLFSSE